MKYLSWSFFLVLFCFQFSSCGGGILYDEKSEEGGNSVNPSNGENSEDGYKLTATGTFSDDFQTVKISGSVSGSPSSSSGSTRALSSGSSGLKIVIEQGSTGQSKTATTNSSGSFSATFNVGEGSNYDESFDVRVEDSAGIALTDTVAVEVDLAGEWEGEMAITSKSSSCEKIPLLSSLDAPVTIEQAGTNLTVYLGGVLDLYPIPVSVTLGDQMIVSGEGNIDIPSSLASVIGCYSDVSYSFDGEIFTDSTPATFDVDFEATLSGTTSGCSNPASSNCTIEGTLEGEKI